MVIRQGDFIRNKKGDFSNGISTNGDNILLPPGYDNGLVREIRGSSTQGLNAIVEIIWKSHTVLVMCPIEDAEII